VLVPVAYPRSGAGLIELAGAIAGRDASHLVYALHLRRPVDREAYRTGIDPEAEAEDSEPLQPLLAHAAKLKVAVEPISFVSRDVATDIADLADHRKIDLVLMGFHKPVIGTAILGGTVHKVLSQTQTNVAILVDRGYRGAKKILVPWLGSPHDTLAMEIARRLGARPEVQITVLHVVSSDRQMNAGAVKVVEKVFSEPGVAQQVHFKVVQDEDPVGVVARFAKEADLTIIGVGEEWGLESHLFGFKSERIAEELENSLLIVRRHHALPAPVNVPQRHKDTEKAPETPAPSSL
jgi:nucleotide-binding universal stress UspA family protein